MWFTFRKHFLNKQNRHCLLISVDCSLLTEGHSSSVAIRSSVPEEPNTVQGNSE